MKFNLFPKGYTLIEAMVALTVLSTSLIVSISIITSSADSENLNRDLFVGSQLADEGIQIMINLYQTNLLKFGKDNIANCALMPLSFDDGPEMCIPSGESLETGNYFVALKPNTSEIQWEITKVDGELINGDDTLNEDFRLYLFTDPNAVTFYTANIPDSSQSDYFRVIEINEVTSENASITSKVSWLRTGGFITTRETSFIINFE